MPCVLPRDVYIMPAFQQWAKFAALTNRCRVFVLLFCFRAAGVTRVQWMEHHGFQVHLYVTVEAPVGQPCLLSRCDNPSVSTTRLLLWCRVVLCLSPNTNCHQKWAKPQQRNRKQLRQVWPWHRIGGYSATLQYQLFSICGGRGKGEGSVNVSVCV